MCQDVDSKKVKRLLVIQTAYSYSEMSANSLEIYFTSKELNGYFSQVVTVNPISINLRLNDDDSSKFGKTRLTIHNSTHTVFEGSRARLKRLKKFEKFNFFLGQIDLFLKLFSFLRKHPVDFVRAEDPRYAGLWGLVLSRLLRKPLLVGVWGNPDTQRQLLGGPMSPKLFKSTWLERWIEKKVLKKSDMALAQNDDNLNYILGRGISVDKTAIFKLGNGIHECHFSDPSKRDLPEYRNLSEILKENRLVVCVGQLEKRKIYEDVFETINLIRSKFQVLLVIIGDGTQRKNYEQLVTDLELSKVVKFLGQLPQMEIAKWLAIANLVLSPLTGRALTEALLAAAPVVAYDIDCHRELIISGFSGELVKYRDVGQMALKSMELLGNPTYASRLGSQARDFVLDFMDPNEINRVQIEIYQRLQYS